MEEVQKHNSELDCWTVVDGKVYNITHFIHRHPGGRGNILRSVGIDSTELFRKFFLNRNHSYCQFKTYLIVIISRISLKI